MKSLKKVIGVLLILTTMTGCVKYKNTMTINSDKSMVFEGSYLISDKLLEQSDSKTFFTDEDKKALEERGVSVEKKQENGYTGISISKKYDNIEPVDLNKDLVEDMFYYGFPIHNKKVKRMHDYINEYIPYIMDYVEEARALNDYSVVERFLKDDKAGKIIRDGLEYCPSCALYGISPNSYAKALENNKES